MPYDDAFYQAYTDYLNEPTVRAAHDWIFAIASKNDAFNQVVDLGCGRHQEFWNWFRPGFYTGVDLNGDPQQHAWIEDYRTFDFARLNLKTAGYQTTAFVSLFSSEITAPYRKNYELYNRIFSECPTIQAGLVSGFYYERLKDFNPIREAGDILSWQTLQPIHVPCRSGYTERRIILPVPSKMFGPEVWQVWKFFEREAQP